MPIYDYVCASCRQKTEVIHGIDAPGPRFCPACGAEGTMRKTFAAPTVHFKGSGWAKKDRSSSSGTRTRAAAAGESGDGSSKAGDSSATSGSDGEKGSASGGDAGGGDSTSRASRGTDTTTTKGTGGAARSDEG